MTTPSPVIYIFCLSFIHFIYAVPGQGYYEPPIADFDCSYRDNGMYKVGCSSSFYWCWDGRATKHRCAEGTYFSEELKQCDYFQNVKDCSGKIPPGDTVLHIASKKFPIDCDTNKDGNYPDPRNPCSDRFYTCSNGQTFERSCPYRLKYDATLDRCEYEENVAACSGARPPPRVPGFKPKQEIDAPRCPRYGSASIATGRCSPVFLRCFNGRSQQFTCPYGQVFDAARRSCWTDRDVSSCRPADNRQTDGRCPVAERAIIKFAKCDQRYIVCSNGVGRMGRCPNDLVFDERQETCAYSYQLSECAPVQPFGYESTIRCPMTGEKLLSYDQCDPRYIQCRNGLETTLRCPALQMFDPEEGNCKHREKVRTCGRQRGNDRNDGRSSGTPTFGAKDGRCPAFGEGAFRLGGRCDRKYLRCWDGRGFVETCPIGYIFDIDYNTCRERQSVGGCQRQRKTDKCPPSAEGDFPIRVCSSVFLRCSNGSSVRITCSKSGDVFDARIHACRNKLYVKGCTPKPVYFGNSRGSRMSRSSSGAATNQRPSMRERFSPRRYEFTGAGQEHGYSTADSQPLIEALFQQRMGFAGTDRSQQVPRAGIPGGPFRLVRTRMSNSYGVPQSADFGALLRRVKGGNGFRRFEVSSEMQPVIQSTRYTRRAGLFPPAAFMGGMAPRSRSRTLWLPAQKVYPGLFRRDWSSLTKSGGSRNKRSAPQGDQNTFGHVVPSEYLETALVPQLIPSGFGSLPQLGRGLGPSYAYSSVDRGNIQGGDGEDALFSNIDPERFCIGKLDGIYAWGNCLPRFICCFGGLFKTLRCPQYHSFDIAKGRCVLRNRCRPIDTKPDPQLPDQICANVADGVYAIASCALPVYFICREGKTEFRTCSEKGQVFRQLQQAFGVCIHSSYCRGAIADTGYFSGRQQFSNIPYSSAPRHRLHQSINRCFGAANGAYPLRRDCSPEFLICWSGQGSRRRCNYGAVFSKAHKGCVPLNQCQGKPYGSGANDFCSYRQDGIYPLGVCASEFGYCQDGKLDTIVCPEWNLFDIRRFQCVTEHQCIPFQQRRIGHSQPSICHYRKDGAAGFGRCLSIYYECWSGVISYKLCNADYVFEPDINACVPIEKCKGKSMTTDPNFCAKKLEGIYAFGSCRSKYAVCLSGHFRVISCPKWHVFNVDYIRCIPKRQCRLSRRPKDDVPPSRCNPRKEGAFCIAPCAPVYYECWSGKLKYQQCSNDGAFDCKLSSCVTLEKCRSALHTNPGSQTKVEPGYQDSSYPTYLDGDEYSSHVNPGRGYPSGAGYRYGGPLRGSHGRRDYFRQSRYGYGPNSNSYNSLQSRENHYGATYGGHAQIPRGYAERHAPVRYSGYGNSRYTDGYDRVDVRRYPEAANQHYLSPRGYPQPSLGGYLDHYPRSAYGLGYQQFPNYPASQEILPRGGAYQGGSGGGAYSRDPYQGYEEDRNGPYVNDGSLGYFPQGYGDGIAGVRNTYQAGIYPQDRYGNGLEDYYRSAELQNASVWLNTTDEDTQNRTSHLLTSNVTSTDMDSNSTIQNLTEWNNINDVNGTAGQTTISFVVNKTGSNDTLPVATGNATEAANSSDPQQSTSSVLTSQTISPLGQGTGSSSGTLSVGTGNATEATNSSDPQQSNSSVFTSQTISSLVEKTGSIDTTPVGTGNTTEAANTSDTQQQSTSSVLTSQTISSLVERTGSNDTILVATGNVTEAANTSDPQQSTSSVLTTGDSVPQLLEVKSTPSPGTTSTSFWGGLLNSLFQADETPISGSPVSR